jgi:hypothetical protein
MLSRNKIILGLLAPIAVAGCATTPYTGPVQVTRFHDEAAVAQIGQGTIFIENAPGQEEQSLELAPYKAAIARELAQLGYQEAPRDSADYIAQVRVGRYASSTDEGRRGPVSVGVGGSTGSYGSGVGVGLGFNLGGGKSRERIGTDLGVMIREKDGGKTLWEGRANLEVSPGSKLESATANATAIGEALFRGFPGNNGETVDIEVSE